MVAGIENPKTPVPGPLRNPLGDILRVLSQVVVALNNLNFSEHEQLELERRYLLSALTREQEALARFVGMWELAAMKKISTKKGN